MQTYLKALKEDREDPTPIELLDRILDLIWDVECILNFENLLDYARDYIEITIRELEKGMIKL